MSSKTQGDLVREQGDRITALSERLDHVRRDFDRIEQQFLRIEQHTVAEKQTFQETRERLAVVSRDVEKLEKRVDELLVRRSELGKLVLAAVVGGLMSLAVSMASKIMEPLIVPKTSARNG